MTIATELELKNALMQVPGATDSVSNRIVRAVVAEAGLGGTGAIATDTIWNAAGDLVQGTGADTAARLAIGTAGQVLRVNAGATAAEWATSSSGVNTTYTAATLETMRSAGTLTALTQYGASDTGALYWAATTSTLSPLGGPVYLEESGTATIAMAALTAIGTGGEFDVRGYSTLSVEIKNGDAANPFNAFDVSIKNGSGDWLVTHSAAADFAVGDDLLIDCTADGTTTDPTTLAIGKNVLLRFDVRAVAKLRIRAKNATADTSPALGVTWISIKEG